MADPRRKETRDAIFGNAFAVVLVTGAKYVMEFDNELRKNGVRKHMFIVVIATGE